LIDVPVNFAVIWSNPRAERPSSGQLIVKALTGGWCDVCSVRYETRIVCSGDETGPCWGMESETEDVLLTILTSVLRLEALLVVPLPAPCRAAVLILGALFSVSQLHCHTSYQISPDFSF
jgi:hypothetical protein